LRARVKGDLPIRFTNEKLTSYGGLELVARFLRVSRFLERRKEVFSIRMFDTDYGSFRTALALLGMLIVGGSRLGHLRLLARDPLFLRFAQLTRLPDERTLSRWLASLTEAVRERMSRLMRELAYASARLAGVARVTLELEGTVLRTGLCAEGAERGFNPHHPKDKSYYPLTAHLAQTGQLLEIWNRPGNVHDSHRALELLRFLVDDVRRALGRIAIEVRLDAAFFQQEILRFLADSRVEYALKVPMWRWLELRRPIAERTHWTRIAPRLSAFSMLLHIPKWNISQRVVVYRKHVSGETRKNFQLDLFTPDDGHYEYSVVATNKTLSPAALWDFMAGRGGHEKTLGELKQHLAFDTIPTQDWDANCAWQLLVGLAHNLMRHFQLATTAVKRPSTRKRTTQFVMKTLRTLRYELINVPAKLARPQGRSELRIAAAEDTRRRYEATLAALDIAA
jgi:hypothetical protein